MSASNELVTFPAHPPNPRRRSQACLTSLTNEIQRNNAEIHRILFETEQAKLMIDREIQAGITEIVKLGEEKKKKIDEIAKELMKKAERCSGKGKVLMQEICENSEKLEVVIGKLPLNGLIAVPIGREETLDFGREHIEGLYDFKGQFSDEKQHILPFYVSTNIVLTEVKLAAILTKCSLNSFTIKCGSQRIYCRNDSISLHSGGENAKSIRISPGVVIRSGEIVTFEGTVTGERCYCIEYRNSSWKYQTSAVGVTMTLLSDTGRGVFYGVKFRLA